MQAPHADTCQQSIDLQLLPATQNIERIRHHRVRTKDRNGPVATGPFTSRTVPPRTFLPPGLFTHRILPPRTFLPPGPFFQRTVHPRRVHPWKVLTLIVHPQNCSSLGHLSFRTVDTKTIHLQDRSAAAAAAVVTAMVAAHVSEAAAAVAVLAAEVLKLMQAPSALDQFTYFTGTTSASNHSPKPTMSHPNRRRFTQIDDGSPKLTMIYPNRR